MRLVSSAALLVALAAGCGETVASGTGGAPPAGSVSTTSTGTTPEGTGGGVPDAGADGCVPLTCADLGLECGPAGDGCGNTQECGACPCSRKCGDGACLPGPEPETCGQLGVQCGLTGDGCGGTVDCGPCPMGQGCGAGGAAGVCAPLTCDPGWVDCSGVCSDTDSDPENCGGCGQACPSGLSCLCGECFLDCPSKFEAFCGCPVLCTPLGTAQDCSACGDTCAPPNATGACVAGAGWFECAIAACDAGWADCNTFEADGCEVDVLTDGDNCGACGSACPSGQSCAGGVCQ